LGAVDGENRFQVGFNDCKFYNRITLVEGFVCVFECLRLAIGFAIYENGFFRTEMDKFSLVVFGMNG
jgi:hypothetical protein